jgi:hypothetical protein
MKMSHVDILWFTFLTITTPLFILWRMKGQGWGIRITIVAMMLTLVLVDVAIWRIEW